MLFAELAIVSQRLAATPKRSEKTALLADLLRHLSPSEITAAVGFLTGTPRQGRIGVGWATLSDVRVAPAASPRWSIGDVDEAVDRLAAIGGSGVVAARRELLAGLLADMTPAEQELFVRVIGGELRHGALDGVMTDAVAKASGVPVAAVRRGAMLSGDLAAAAHAALTGGNDAVAAIGLTPLHPVLPMLAATSAGVAEALAGTGVASVEWKLDGARIQAHRRAGEVRLFTRNLNDVSDRLGGVVDVVAALPGGDLVLDGEVLGLDADGAPRRFQDTMGDFGADAPGRGAGLTPFFFDVLHVGGSSVVDEPLAMRRELLVATVPATARLPSIVTADAAEAEAFLDRAVAAGHEGVMVKSIDSPYDAGRRGGAWRKVKPVHTLDLVVIAVEWGHGRRSGWLSNLHLSALGADGAFVMVGKTFKGLTDELLRWQTAELQARAIATDGHVVHVRPELVVEIALDGVQVSSRYPGGVALRFARVRRYRLDKAPHEADTIERVRSLLR